MKPARVVKFWRQDQWAPTTWCDFLNSVYPIKIIYLIHCSWLQSLLVCKMDPSVQLQCTVCTRQVAAYVHKFVFRLLWWKFSIRNLLWEHVVENRMLVSCGGMIYCLFICWRDIWIWRLTPYVCVMTEMSKLKRKLYLQAVYKSDYKYYNIWW